MNVKDLYLYEGIRNSGTFPLDDETSEKIKGDVGQIRRKVVCMTDNGVVGYGKGGEDPWGFVIQVEPESANNPQIIVSVEWHTTHDNVPCSGAEKFNGYAACDGNGGLRPSNTPTSCRVQSVDTENKTLIARML